MPVMVDWLSPFTVQRKTARMLSPGEFLRGKRGSVLLSI